MESMGTHHLTLEKPVTAIMFGAGARANVYGNYALAYPDQLDIIGVADPNPVRRERYAHKHRIPDDQQFRSWEDVCRLPKLADAVIIATPDHLHTAPCIAALRKGYDVLLEKPIAPNEEECRLILQTIRETGRMVAVCHVLRYSPYFLRMKEIIDSGRIGRLMSIQHMEPIDYTHMAHSFVRGNWRNSRQSTPILLAKSCHDLDVIRWLVGSPTKEISAFGELGWFKAENAPAGSTERCTDGCAVERECPYSAIRIYLEQKKRLYVFELPPDPAKHDEAVLEYLKTTNYGRCVYRMDNDQPDHYVTNMVFENGVTASFNMEAFTPWGNRRTRVMGSHGFIEGNMDQLVVYDFRHETREEIHLKVQDVKGYKNEGHGGGDWRMVNSWIRAIVTRDESHLSSTIDVSFESHIMCFQAEASRLSGRVLKVTM